METFKKYFFNTLYGFIGAYMVLAMVVLVSMM